MSDVAIYLPKASAMLPKCDTVRVEEMLRGPAPFKIVAWKDGLASWCPFTDEEDLELACKIVAKSLKTDFAPKAPVPADPAFEKQKEEL